MAVIDRDEYFGLKLSPTSPKILYSSHSSRIVLQKKIIQNTKTKEKKNTHTKNNNHIEVDRHIL